jgi:hypothetical protein
MSSAALLLYHVRFAVRQRARPLMDLLAVFAHQSGTVMDDLCTWAREGRPWSVGRAEDYVHDSVMIV